MTEAKTGIVGGGDFTKLRIKSCSLQGNPGNVGEAKDGLQKD